MVITNVVFLSVSHSCFYLSPKCVNYIFFPPRRLISMPTLCQSWARQQEEGGWRCVRSSWRGGQGWRYRTAGGWSRCSVPPSMDTPRWRGVWSLAQDVLYLTGILFSVTLFLSSPGCGVAAKARCRYQRLWEAGSHRPDARRLRGPHQHCGTAAVKGWGSPPPKQTSHSIFYLEEKWLLCFVFL